jgi:hypothetical protein
MTLGKSHKLTLEYIKLKIGDVNLKLLLKLKLIDESIIKHVIIINCYDKRSKTVKRRMLYVM